MTLDIALSGFFVGLDRLLNYVSGLWIFLNTPFDKYEFYDSNSIIGSVFDVTGIGDFTIINMFFGAFLNFLALIILMRLIKLLNPLT